MDEVVELRIELERVKKDIESQSKESERQRDDLVALERRLNAKIKERLIPLDGVLEELQERLKTMPTEQRIEQRMARIEWPVKIVVGALLTAATSGLVYAAFRAFGMGK